MRINNNKTLILKHLRNNARKSFSLISRDTGIAVTTIFDNYHKLLESKVITRHTSLVDFKSLGFFFRSFIFVKANKKNELMSFLRDHDNVNSVFRVSRYDCLIDTVFPTIKEFYYFLDELNGFDILEIDTHDVIEHLKREEFFSEC